MRIWFSTGNSDRRKQELLKKHFTKSISILEPIKEKNEATDNLIDKNVYKLYSLKLEEIEIVEGEIDLGRTQKYNRKIHSYF
ncbi:MAG: hypothetical protein HY578_07740 [Nitrospinae bacterium]|nr:hypothetical protein [Nitrospinota bacterium]